MNIIYTLPQTNNCKSILNNLKKEITLKKESSWSGDRCYYDSFDWRLYNNSLLLYLEQNKICLISRKNQVIQESMTINKLPRFSADLPDGTVKKKLDAILAMRALIKLGCHHIDQTKYRVLDKNDKTVVYLIFDILRWKSSITQVLITLAPIKGYETYLSDLQKKLQGHGLVKFKGDVFKQILQRNHRQPNDYSSKININLRVTMSTYEATIVILSSLLHTMKRNEEGIIKDIDTEFLHDYRVAIRRIRSAFGQFRNVFIQEIYIKAKKEYSQLGRLTNRMRDIDVYLLKKLEYLKMLPGNMQGDIDSFFTNLSKERKTELKKLTNYLKSEEYKNIISHWEKFIMNSSADEHGEKDSKRLILPFAKDAILKRYKKVVKLGARITQYSPDVLLHQLRIECKKLRYLLEFFSSLFAQKEINYLIKQLKLLQDNLGDFNDLSVQQETLGQYAQKDSNKKTLIAIGILIGKLSESQIKVRQKFSESFYRFGDQTTKSLFFKLFATKAENEK